MPTAIIFIYLLTYLLTCLWCVSMVQQPSSDSPHFRVMYPVFESSLKSAANNTLVVSVSHCILGRKISYF